MLDPVQRVGVNATRTAMKTRMSISSFVRQLIASLISGIAALLSGKELTMPAFGDILARSSFSASSLVMSPTQPQVPVNDAIPKRCCYHQYEYLGGARALSLWVPGLPTWRLSPDGVEAYVAASTSSFVVVFESPEPEW